MENCALFSYNSATANMNEVSLINKKLMIEYGNPVCPLTQQPAIAFCFTSNCSQPAFACHQQELARHGHYLDIKFNFWSSIFPVIRRNVQGELHPSDIENLKRQQKQLQAFINQLKDIHQSHRNYLQLCRKKQKLNGYVEKFVEALRSKTTNTVTGNDMAKIVRAIKEDNVFVNKLSVNTAIEQSNFLIENSVLLKLRSLIEDYKHKATNLLRLQQIPNQDLKKVCPFVDTANSNTAVLNNDIFTIRSNQEAWHPVFAKQQVIDGQSFEVIVTDATVRLFMIGVATSNLRNTINQFNNKDGMNIDACGYLNSDGAFTKYDFELHTNHRITVRRNGQSIEWLRDGKPLRSQTIPDHIRRVPLFPVCWIHSRQPAKLRFVPISQML